MGDEIVIDKTAFFNRLSGFYAAWKADKRSANSVFGGAGSIIILMGKTDEANSYQKNNAIHVCCLRRQLLIISTDTFSFGYSATNSQLHFSSSHRRLCTL